MKPILFSWGPFHFFSYGAMIAVGVLVALTLMQRQARHDGFPTGQGVYDYVFCVLFSGFLGARFLYVIQNWDGYATEPWRVLAFWEGGLVFYGGLITSFAAVWIFARRRGEDARRVFDFLLPYVALAHAFGRLGCFLNGCCYGKFCELPWAVQFPETPHPVHPTQLYEAAFNFFLFLFLRHWYKRRQYPGEVMTLYFILYPAARFIIEFWRADNPVVLVLTWNQWLCMLIILVSGSCFFRMKGQGRVA
jgi:phosphatidylglycerol:prolipoprotein diacylglycerol transferase